MGHGQIEETFIISTEVPDLDQLVDVKEKCGAKLYLLITVKLDDGKILHERSEEILKAPVLKP
jgi:hypothetical protein